MTERWFLVRKVRAVVVPIADPTIQYRASSSILAFKLAVWVFTGSRMTERWFFVPSIHTIPLAITHLDVFNADTRRFTLEGIYLLTGK